MTGDRKRVSIVEAANLVGVSRRTIYNWLRRRRVEYVRTASGSVRIYEDTLWRADGPRSSVTPEYPAAE